jgi:hypothetical protein
MQGTTTGGRGRSHRDELLAIQNRRTFPLRFRLVLPTMVLYPSSLCIVVLSLLVCRGSAQPPAVPHVPETRHSPSFLRWKISSSLFARPSRMT